MVRICLFPSLNFPQSLEKVFLAHMCMTVSTLKSKLWLITTWVFKDHFYCLNIFLPWSLILSCYSLLIREINLILQIVKPFCFLYGRLGYCNFKNELISQLIFLVFESFSGFPLCFSTPLGPVCTLQ